MRKMISSLLMFVMVLSCLVVYADEGKPSAWAEPEVNSAIEAGYVVEELQGDYQTQITRAEFAKTAVLFYAKKMNMQTEDALSFYLETHVDEFGNPLVFQAEVFADTKGHKDADYIDWAYNLSIIKGREEGVFDPDTFITREEAATMLLRVYFCYGGGVKLGTKSEGVDAFSDKEMISSWADTAIRYMYQWDVMKGVSETEFDPRGHYTREQCFATFERLDAVYSILSAR